MKDALIAGENAGEPRHVSGAHAPEDQQLMSLTYVLSPMAEADLEQIWTYTAQEWFADQAESYTNGIINVFQDIATESGLVGKFRCERDISKH